MWMMLQSSVITTDQLLEFADDGQQTRMKRARPQFGRIKPIERRKGSQIKREVLIACPVCYSGNQFQLERPEQELSCHDCGFVLGKNLELKISESENCVFCGSNYFYFESPLDLSFLGRAAICYVCEARYKGSSMDNPDEEYKKVVARNARRSSPALRWRERVALYDTQAEL
jgi:hypothetical protein